MKTLLQSAPWINEDRVDVVLKGVDEKIYRDAGDCSLRERLHLSTTECIVGFVGRLDEQKGIPTLMEAIRIAAAEHPFIKLVIAGTGNLQPYIENYCREHHLQANAGGNLFQK